MGEARERVIAALSALLVQVIIVLASLSVYLLPEPSTVEGVPAAASAHGVAEPG